MNGQWLRWLDHVIRMDESPPPLKLFDAVLAGESRKEENPHCVGKVSHRIP